MGNHTSTRYNPCFRWIPPLKRHLFGLESSETHWEYYNRCHRVPRNFLYGTGKLACYDRSVSKTVCCPVCELTGLHKVLVIDTNPASCFVFDFLSEDCFVLPRANAGVELWAEIFVIQGDSSNAPQSEDGDARLFPIQATALRFPELPLYHVFSFDVYTQSEKRARSRNSSDPFCSNLLANDGDRIIAFNVIAALDPSRHGGHISLNYHFIIYGESLLPY